MGTSEESAFSICYEKSIGDAFSLAILLMKQKDWPNVSSLIYDEIYTRYTNQESLPSNLIELFIKSSSVDFHFKMDELMRDESNIKYCSAAAGSLQKKFLIMRELNNKIQKCELDEKRIEDYLSYYTSYNAMPLTFDVELSENNWNRVRRLSSSGHPSDAFPPLRELNRQSFEQLYKPISKEVFTIVDKFTGNEEVAHCFSEKLLCYNTCYEEQGKRGEKRYFSDVKEIRNCDSHFEFHEKDDQIIFKSSKIEKKFTLDDMLTYMVVCASNYDLLFRFVPFLHLAVLRKIESIM